ncbi:MBL fold metallo-hydrolase [Chloroflexota bacterium]
MTNPNDKLSPVDIRPNIYQLPSAKPGSHVYLIKGETKNVLIDTGVTAGFENLKKQLNQLGLGVNDVHLIILTHEHFDHIGATPFFESAIIAAHSNAANKIELQDEFVTYNKERNIGVKPFYPHIWLDDGTIIDIGNHKLEVIHTPGHTSGCICLYEPNLKLLFSGDTVFAGGLLSDIAGSGSISDYVRSLHRLGNRRIEAFYPAHGRIYTAPENDIHKAIEYARSVMEESKLLFEALARSEARDKVKKRLAKAPMSGISRLPKPNTAEEPK